MYTRISYFIKDNMETSEELNEENILKKYGRKGFNKLIGNPTVSENFVEKMIQFIEQRWGRSCKCNGLMICGAK